MNRFRLPNNYDDGEWLDQQREIERQIKAERYQRKVEEWQEKDIEEKLKQEAR